MKGGHGFDAVTFSIGEGDAQSDPSQAIAVSNQFSLTALVYHQGKNCVFIAHFLCSELESGIFVCNPGKNYFKTEKIRHYVCIWKIIATIWQSRDKILCNCFFGWLNSFLGMTLE